MMNITAVIPARISSTRLPEKPLADIGGKPLIQWVYENTRKSRFVRDVIVATDSERIIAAVKAFGGKAVMTRSDHPSGTDRIAEVAQSLDTDIILNVQGDEPFIETPVIDTVLQAMVADAGIRLGSARTPVADISEIFTPSVVKVICDKDDFAIYFSRAPIPFFRDEFEQYKSTGRLDSAVEARIKDAVFKHIGIYAYRKDFLMQYTKMPQTLLETAEKLEQLRALENGVRIKVPAVRYNGFGIDTREDLDRALKILKG